jgi:hypothetical protein
MRLQTLYEKMRNAKDSFLSFSSIARIGGALLLTTLSIVLPAIIEKVL